MHIRRGFLGWGVFLILAGAVPLAVRSGYLSEDQVGRLWTLWPLILVGIGVGLILSRTRFDFLGGIIVAATFGLMVGGLLSSGIGTFSTGACGEAGGTTAFPPRDGTFARAAARSTSRPTAATSRSPLRGRQRLARRRRGRATVSGRTSRPPRRPSVSGPGTTAANPFWAFGTAGHVADHRPPGRDHGRRPPAQRRAGEHRPVGRSHRRLRAPAECGLGDRRSRARPRRSSGIDIELNAGSVGVTLPHVSMIGTHPRECRCRPFVRTGGCRAEAAHRREHRGEL